MKNVKSPSMNNIASFLAFFTPVNVPTCTLLLLSSLMLPTAQAATSNLSTDSSIHNDENQQARCLNLTPANKNNITARQRSIACMIEDLKPYQLKTMTAEQQYWAYKAQAWLNYANHEDSIKSRSAAGKSAFDSGVIILQKLHSGDVDTLNLVVDIPTTSALMRPDLWATISALKDSGGIATAPRELAFSEVGLIWAAANQCEQGSQQSGAHFRMSDRWLEQAREAYVNAHNAEDNMALITLINDYYKEYAPLDAVDDRCEGQTLTPYTERVNPSAQKGIKVDRRHLALTQNIMIPMPIPTATYRIF